LLLISYATGDLDKGLEYGNEELGILSGIEKDNSMLLAGAHNNLAMLYEKVVIKLILISLSYSLKGGGGVAFYSFRPFSATLKTGL